MADVSLLKSDSQAVSGVQTPLPNYVNNTWQQAEAAELLDVTNPATGEVLTQVPLSPAEEVHQAATAAADALHEWRRTPPVERIQYLFALKKSFRGEFGGYRQNNYAGVW
jgi:malonate-semialdehyde dehydrogenase (acetylating)/methylmalonate-semialdehyde dehydrogenase